MKPKAIVEEFWKEYPDRDPEYVRWYPPGLTFITPEEIWRPLKGDDIHREIAFYLHVPFCLQLCKYCPFSKAVWSAQRVEQYMAALEREIDLVSRLPYLQGARVVAGYLGGGTPTALALEQLAQITSQLNDCFDIAPEAELSIEANPDTVNVEKLQYIRQLGFNRISLGVQSFNDDLLVQIGRTHRADTARQAIQLALNCGFDNVGIDLIFGLPGQTIELWQHDLTEAVTLGLHQVTMFGLYVPPGTVLYRETKAGKIGNYPDEAQKWAMYQQAEEILTRAGYEQYTAYDFALPGKASRHHAINWQAPQGEYLGLGPGAFSYIHGHIFANVSDLDAYVSILDEGNLPVAKGCAVSRREAMSRFMVLGLKYLSVSKEAFSEQFGTAIEHQFGPVLTQLEDWGLIQQDTERVWVTEKGKTYLGNVSKAFYTAEQMGKPQPRV
jgi:oxygen-independent coproporphyrinogen-3 oxidase